MHSYLGKFVEGGLGNYDLHMIHLPNSNLLLAAKNSNLSSGKCKVRVI